MDEEVSMLFIFCPPWRPHHTVGQALTYFTHQRGKASSDFLSDCEHSCLILDPHTANYPNRVDKITYCGSSKLI